MTLRMLLTGNPSNIEEFSEIAKEITMPVEVLLNAYSQIGHDTIKGKIIYSIGTHEEVLAGRNFEWIQKYKMVRTEKRFCTHSEMIAELKKEAQPNLKYLYYKGIEYKILELTEP